jgi:hypothetical protein
VQGRRTLLLVAALAAVEVTQQERAVQAPLVRVSRVELIHSARLVAPAVVVRVKRELMLLLAHKGWRGRWQRCR